MVLLLIEEEEGSVRACLLWNWTLCSSVWFGTQNYNSLRLSFSLWDTTNNIYLAEVLQGHTSEIRHSVWKHCARQKAACRTSLDKYLPPHWYQMETPSWKWTKREAEQEFPFGDKLMGGGEMWNFDRVKSDRRQAKVVVQVCFSAVAGRRCAPLRGTFPSGI